MALRLQIYNAARAPEFELVGATTASRVRLIEGRAMLINTLRRVGDYHRGRLNGH